MRNINALDVTTNNVGEILLAFEFVYFFGNGHIV